MAAAQLVEYVAKSLADNPDGVSVEVEEDGDAIILRLLVDEEPRARNKAQLRRVSKDFESKGAVKTANAANLRNAQIRRCISQFRGRSSLRFDSKQPSADCALPSQYCRCVR